MLLSALVNQGVVVVKEAAAADVTVDIDTQTVKFTKDRPQYDYAGAPTALAGGAWALHGVAMKNSAAATAAAGATVGLIAIDALHWFRSEFATGDTPQNEIFVTVTASDKNRYLARTSNVYYVADSDQGMYALAPVAPNPKVVNIYGDR